jgi:hypothetical protein
MSPRSVQRVSQPAVVTTLTALMTILVALLLSPSVRGEDKPPRPPPEDEGLNGQVGAFYKEHGSCYPKKYESARPSLGKYGPSHILPFQVIIENGTSSSCTNTKDWNLSLAVKGVHGDVSGSSHKTEGSSRSKAQFYDMAIMLPASCYISNDSQYFIVRKDAIVELDNGVSRSTTGREGHARQFLLPVVVMKQPGSFRMYTFGRSTEKGESLRVGAGGSVKGTGGGRGEGVATSEGKTDALGFAVSDDFIGTCQPVRLYLELWRQGGTLYPDAAGVGVQPEKFHERDGELGSITDETGTYYVYSWNKVLESYRNRSKLCAVAAASDILRFDGPAAKYDPDATVDALMRLTRDLNKNPEDMRVRDPALKQALESKKFLFDKPDKMAKHEWTLNDEGRIINLVEPKCGWDVYWDEAKIMKWETRGPKNAFPPCVLKGVNWEK